ncbi:TauD/TfdA family dioxygenase [Frankia sp. Ag45/Mut15]|uniref:TauD/TfdA family dioxygenase n=1 Tax=Frankia umida TaxID=573489 RepID=A0ABT0K220_9ACTN|nr:TauD/TfdA family dioxygenase [Frankia umida]MCK9877834.1 TauD/TfdA family dioxygenase [Frankia umida]
MAAVPTEREPHLLWHTPAGAGRSLLEFVAERRDDLRGQLRSTGALLFRDFAVNGPKDFDAAIQAFAGQPALAYSERSSPRSTIEGNIYTSTDYPADEEIFLHNENSYQARWPMTLGFYCLQPPSTRGATPLADTRAIIRRIDPQVREQFESRRWMVVRNLYADFGIAWQKIFGTGDRNQVADYCASNGISVDWLPGDGLRTRAVRDAVRIHPVTGDRVWFNHATFFHLSTVGAEVRDGLLALFGPDDLPTQTYFGDGGAIPLEVMDHLRECYRAETYSFDWRRGDVLLIDNMLTAHAREPFTGPRTIAVAMAEPFVPAG